MGLIAGLRQRSRLRKKFSELVTSGKRIDQIIEEHCRANPTFAAEWARAELARLIATLVLRYRVEADLTQEQLAAITGLDIETLEMGGD